MGQNKAVLVGSAKVSVSGDSPKHLENPKTKFVSKNLIGNAFNRWIFVFHDGHPLLVMGVGGSVLVGSAKTSVLGSSAQPNENSTKNRSEKVPNRYTISRFSSK